MKPGPRDSEVSDTMARCLISLTPEYNKRNARGPRYSQQTYTGLVKRGLIYDFPWWGEIGEQPPMAPVWVITDAGWQWLRAHPEVWGFASTDHEKFALARLKTPTRG